MRAIGVTCAFVCGLWAISAAIPSRSQPAQVSTFGFAVCNMSSSPSVFVAVDFEADAAHWKVEGWHAVPDKGCALIGTYPRDTIYYYAVASTGAAWRGADTDQTAKPLCIDRAKWFESTIESATCPAGQTSVRFKMIKIAPNLPRLTWTLTGS